MTASASVSGSGTCSQARQQKPACCSWQNADGTPLSVYKCYYKSSGKTYFCLANGKIFISTLGGNKGSKPSDQCDSNGPYYMDGTNRVAGQPN